MIAQLRELLPVCPSSVHYSRGHAVLLRSTFCAECLQQLGPSLPRQAQSVRVEHASDLSALKYPFSFCARVVLAAPRKRACRRVSAFVAIRVVKTESQGDVPVVTM